MQTIFPKLEKSRSCLLDQDIRSFSGGLSINARPVDRSAGRPSGWYVDQTVEV